MAVSLSLAALAVSANPRSLTEIKRLAECTLNGVSRDKRLPGKVYDIRQLKRSANCTIMGNNRGYVVISNDDAFPGVIAYSDDKWTDTAELNDNFQWWLKAVDAIMGYRVASGDKTYLPSKRSVLYASKVMPLTEALWGQDAPYNNDTPTEGGRHTLTGCVATAMAEIMYCYKYPIRGRGSHAIYYPYGSSSGQKVYADFENTSFDWNNILPLYTNGYNDEQASAIAELMHHCGVAVDMQYGVDASGALPQAAATAFVRYFGYPTAVTYADRSNVANDSIWMDIIYKELNDHCPVFYTGTDLTSNMGHAFVIDGYDENGLVHVNWGWEGQNNGYYNIDLLNPSNYKFQYSQSMTYGIKGREINPKSVDLKLNAPGTLSSVVGEENVYKISKLTLHGSLNAADIKTLADMAGRDSLNRKTRGSLSSLDISDCNIVSGGDSFLSISDTDYTTSDNVLPDMAFYNCQYLDTLILPKTLKKIGHGAIGMCTSLSYVNLPKSGDNFVLEGSLVLSSDSSEVIAVLPTNGEVTIPEGVKSIAPYAMAGNTGINKVVVPSSLESIGAEAFRYCWQLKEFRVKTEKMPVLTGSDVFGDVNFKNCIVYVPVGTKNNYLSDKQWAQFVKLSGETRYNNIKEFGLLVKARNYEMSYGDNLPKFGYTIQGEAIIGRPVLSCEASKESPVGEYEIKVNKGTLRNSYIILKNGALFIKPAKLSLIADTITILQDEPMPVLTFHGVGFKNNEDASVLTVQPVLSCEVTDTHTPGKYIIKIDDAMSVNYDISYTNGILNIVLPTDVKEIRTAKRNNIIYDLSGRTIVEGAARGQILIKDHKKIIK